MNTSPKLIDTVLDIGRQCLLQRRGLSMDADISQGEFAAVDLLDVGEKVSCNALAKRIGLSESRSSRLIDRLLHKGYVVRRTDPKNRRAVLLWLSPKGVRLKKKIEKLKNECEQRLFGAIENEKLTIVREGMTILRETLRSGDGCSEAVQ